MYYLVLNFYYFIVEIISSRMQWLIKSIRLILPFSASLCDGKLPLHVVSKQRNSLRICNMEALKQIFQGNPSAILHRDNTYLTPYLLAALNSNLDVAYELLRLAPEQLLRTAWVTYDYAVHLLSIEEYVNKSINTTPYQIVIYEFYKNEASLQKIV